MTLTDKKRERQADKLYEIYAKPLEQKHRGKFIAIAPDGKFVLGDNLLGVMEQATDQFGPGNFVFKIGEKAVGKWR